jgi:endonuclease YncB( thermonuclease family)
MVGTHGGLGTSEIGKCLVAAGLCPGGAGGGGCSQQGDLSAGEQGRVARVLDGDSLALDTGLRVRLVEVEAPAPGYDGRVDEPWAMEAKAVLAAAAVGRQAQLWYGGLEPGQL